MPNNKKVIKREDLESVIKAYLKWYEDNNEDEEINDKLWKQWKDACVKAFPTDRRCYREFETLKSVSRVIGHKDFETIVKVYQALGYEII